LRGPGSGEPRDDDGEGCAAPDPASLGTTTARARGPGSGESRDDDGEAARPRIRLASGRRRRGCASPDPSRLGTSTATTAKRRGSPSPGTALGDKRRLPGRADRPGLCGSLPGRLACAAVARRRQSRLFNDQKMQRQKLAVGAVEVRNHRY
ncbi:hypothetical protein EJB05_13795, partial [Eragrostis curvula]